MNIGEFTDLYFESLKLFKHFGKAVALGFQDIDYSAHEMLKNKATLTNHFDLPEDGAPEIKYIEQ